VRGLLLLTFGIAFTASGLQANAASPTRACDTPAAEADRDLNAGQTDVVPGGGVFVYGHDQYPFATYSIASPDPTSPGRICLRYEVRNTRATSAGTSVDPVLRSFRWNDIGLPFVDIPPGPDLRWFKPDFSAFQSAYIAPSEVGAFEKSRATTTAILTGETVAAREKPGSGPPPLYPLYNLTDRLPAVAPILKSAHIPATPVRAVSLEQAEALSTITNRFSVGKTILNVGSQFSKDSRAIQTSVTIEGPARTEAQLFAPTLHEDRKVGPVSLDLIRLFVSEAEKGAIEPRSLKDGRYVSILYPPPPKTKDEPAFFIVTYPLTVRSKTNSFCIVVTGFSPYPLNLDGSYCAKR
jgi:hypothetical protein